MKNEGAFLYLFLTGGAVSTSYAGYMTRPLGLPEEAGWFFLGMSLYAAVIAASCGYRITWRQIVDAGNMLAICLLACLLQVHWNQASARDELWYLAICLMTPSLIFYTSIVYRAIRFR